MIGKETTYKLFKMSKNSVSFLTFRGQICGQRQLSNGDETFSGRIIYKFNGQSLQETLEVTLRLTTSEYGRVSIEDGAILNSDGVHMEFNSDFQVYSFTNDGFLIIKGHSKKNWKLRINNNSSIE